MPDPKGEHRSGVPDDEQEERKHPSGAWLRTDDGSLEETHDGSNVAALSDEDVSTRYGEGDLIDGKYRLVRLLGQGGMGDVWLAHNETLDIDVAVKLIRADAEGGDHGDRLLREARAAARLGHPAIVRIFDFGRSEYGDPFIVMELLEGEDLATALDRRGRLSAVKAVRTILPIIHALSAAHSKGIVHRDIKPENIYLQLTEDNQLQPKLVDFGIAKLDRSKTLRLTQTGALLGSPLYMSPEQARGDDVDHRGDIWSLCVVLYEMICGRPPFEGKNYNAVLYSIIANQPPPSTQLGAGDEALWVILDSAFKKDPDHRPQTMRELGESLALWLSERGVSEDITGASIESAWLQRSTRRPGDALSSVAPPPRDAAAAPPREGIETRLVKPKPPEHPSKRIWIVGIGAAALAVGIAMTLWLGGREEPVTAEPEPPQAAAPAVERAGELRAAGNLAPSAAAHEAETSATDPGEAPPIPVEALDEAPPEGSPEESTGGAIGTRQSSSAAKRSTTRRSNVTRHAPSVRAPRPAKKPALKDPFQ